MRALLYGFLFLLTLLIAGCGGSSTGSGGGRGIQVILATPSVSLSQNGVYTFEVSVSGTPNTTVNWSVVGGDANGTITPAGRYTAPNVAGVYQVVAVSDADSGAVGRATIVVSTGVNLTLSPQNPTVKIGSDVQFNTTVTGTANNALRYNVLGSGVAGTVSATGLYTAPNEPGTYEVTVTSLADETRTTRTFVTVIPGVDVRILTPKVGSVCLPQSTLNFTSRVTGNADTDVIWTIEEPGGGTITVDGRYTAPNVAGTYTVRATSEADPTQIVRFPVRVANEVNVRVSVRGKGDIVMRLAEGTTPRHARNMVSLTNNGFYDGIIFHRYEPGFVIQGGDPLTKTLPLSDPSIGTGGPGYTIDLELSPLRHLKYSLGMARGTDLNSAGSQWYICLEAQPSLDGQYTVFGQVILGQSIVDALRRGDVIERMTVEAVN